MPELDVFEARLADGLRSYAGRAVVTVDAVEVAWHVGEGKARRPSIAELLLRRPAFAWLLVAAALVGLLGALTVSGAIRLDRVFPAPPPAEELSDADRWLLPTSSSSSLLAVSRDEAWIADGVDAWRVRGSALEEVPPIPGSGFTRDLERSPDGSIWAANDSGAFRFDGSEWVSMDSQQASSVAVGPDGAVWVAGTNLQAETVIRSFRLVEQSWTAGPVETTDLFHGRPVLAVGQDGTVWSGSNGGYDGRGGVARRVDGRWESVAIGRAANIGVWDLAAGPDGTIWVAGVDFVTMTEGGWREAAWWIARFDGSTWVVDEAATWIDRFEGSAWVVDEAATPPEAGFGGWIDSDFGFTPDGTPVMNTTGCALAVFGGTSWSCSLLGQFTSISIAPDGTVWATADTYLVRLDRLPLAPEPSPSEELSVVVPMAPSGIDVVATWGQTYGRLEPDGDGAIWAYEGGIATRFEPSAGDLRSWDVSDDAAFGSSWVWAPSRKEGIWIADRASGTVRRFDGERFVDVIDAPGSVEVLGEAPDGTLWAASAEGVFRRDGQSWTRVDRPRENASATAIAFAPGGDSWVAWVRYPSPGAGAMVARYDGSAWQTFESSSIPHLADDVRGIEPLADGTVLVAGSDGVARFDGTTWASFDVPGSPSEPALASSADGTLWLAAGTLADGTLSVLQPGRAWTTSSVAMDIAGQVDETHRIASVLPVGDLVYVGTGAGIFRMAGDRWVPMTPAATDGPGAGPTLLAISRDEAWLAGSSSTLRAEGSAVAILPPALGSSSPNSFTRDLARASDGSVWAASDSGAFRFDGAAWVVVDGLPASAIAVGPDGTMWIAGLSQTSGEIVVRSYRLVGGAWRAGAVETTDLLSGFPALAVGQDGTLWLGSAGNWGIKPGLVHLVDGRWEREAIGREAEVAVWDLAAGSDGTIWVAGSDIVTIGGATSTGPYWLAHLDGTGWIVDEGGPAGTARSMIGFAPDGSLVFGETDRGLAVFDGTSRTYRLAGLPLDGFSIAPDGTVWAVTFTQLLRLPPDTLR